MYSSSVILWSLPWFAGPVPGLRWSCRWQAEAKQYYAILEVERTATLRDIRRAYRRLAFQWHPDKWDSEAGKEYAARRFQVVVCRVGCSSVGLGWGGRVRIGRPWVVCGSGTDGP